MNLTCLLTGFYFIFAACSESNSSKEQDNSQPLPVKTDSIPAMIPLKGIKQFYDQYNVEGMIVIGDNQKHINMIYNQAKYDQPVSPASTFNILLTLIGLEEGILKNEKTALTRGDIKYTSKFGGDTCTLEEAFTNNRDWFFIRLSIITGTDKIATWLQKLNYGNASVRGEENRFWINGELAISPSQQLEFIRKFYFEEFPFSKANYQVVKKMMWQKELNGSKIYGKRGSNKLENEKRYTGWFIGYIESGNSLYYFTSLIESPDMNHPKLVDAQKETVFNIIEKLDLK